MDVQTDFENFVSFYKTLEEFEKDQSISTNFRHFYKKLTQISEIVGVI